MYTLVSRESNVGCPVSWEHVWNGSRREQVGRWYAWVDTPGRVRCTQLGGEGGSSLCLSVPLPQMQAIGTAEIPAGRWQGL